MQKALVTGGTGFTGQALCARLLRDGWSVSSFVRASSRVESLRRMGVECLEVDIGDPEQVMRAYQPVDAVFHVAAQYRTETPDRSAFTRINVDATRNLLDAARAKGVGRFVHCSTGGVHGHIEHPPADEDYRTQPNDHYQVSKWEGEQLARRYFAEGLPGAVIRPAAIYGPGDLRFLKLFKAVQKGLFVMVGDGTPHYHLVYIDDLVEGFLRAATRPEAIGQVYIIAGPRSVMVRDLVDQVADTLGCARPRLRVPHWPVHVAAVACEALCKPFGIPPPLYPRRVEFFVMQRSFTTTKAQRELGYVPQVDNLQGLAETARWYREQGLIA
jgi:nucleoside-diphosphate-sugar epimerase